MTVGDLKEKLQKFPTHLEVKVNDGEWGLCNFTLFETKSYILINSEKPEFLK